MDFLFLFFRWNNIKFYILSTFQFFYLDSKYSIRKDLTTRGTRTKQKKKEKKKLKFIQNKTTNTLKHIIKPIECHYQLWPSINIYILRQIPQRMNECILVYTTYTCTCTLVHTVHLCWIVVSIRCWRQSFGLLLVKF